MSDHVRLIPIPERLRAPLRAALRGEESAWPGKLEPAEVDALIAHGVGPLVYAATNLPQLREDALRCAAAEPLRLVDVTAALEAIDGILIKGTALAYDLYPAPELRPRADTDVLIRREDLEQVRTRLLAEGYHERLTSGDEHGIRQAAFSRIDSYGVEHVYDIHWAISNSAVVADMLRFGEITLVPLPRLGDRAFTMPDVEALLLACVHRVVHHQDSQKLIWLVDIDRLRQRMGAEEHARFWALAAERHVVAVCVHSVQSADAWLGRQPRFMPRDIPGDEASRVFVDRDLTYGASTLAELRALPWRARSVRLRQLAFPPRAFMQEAFATRSALALPWLYVYRGLRGVARLFTRAATR